MWSVDDSECIYLIRFRIDVPLSVFKDRTIRGVLLSTQTIRIKLDRSRPPGHVRRPGVDYPAVRARRPYLNPSLPLLL